MINTLPGTLLLLLTINFGEDHTDGWFFSLQGDGLHDGLFTIVDNEVRAGNSYIPPGIKSVNVVANHGTYGTHTSTIDFNIGDYGRISVVGSIIFTPPDHFPVLGTTYEFAVSFKYDAALPGTDNELAILKLNDTNHVVLNSIGNVSVFPLSGLGSQSSLIGSVALIANEWNVFRMVREDRGDGLRTYYELNDTVLMFYPGEPLVDITKFTPCELLSGSDNVEMSNVLVKIDDVVYVQEELKTGIGIFITGNAAWEYNDLVSFNIIPTVFEYNDLVAFDLGLPSSFLYSSVNDIYNLVPTSYLYSTPPGSYNATPLTNQYSPAIWNETPLTNQYSPAVWDETPLTNQYSPAVWDNSPI